MICRCAAHGEVPAVGGEAGSCFAREAGDSLSIVGGIIGRDHPGGDPGVPLFDAHVPRPQRKTVILSRVYANTSRQAGIHRIDGPPV